MSTDVPESPRPTTQVHVDQVGYLPSAPKVAVTTVDAARFAVVAADDGEVVHTGSLSEQIDDPDAGDTVRWASFTSLSSSGRYRVAVGAGEEADGGLTVTLAQSPTFTVGPDVYDDTLVDCVRLYSLKRSNTAVDDPETGLDVPAGHTKDAQARLFYAHDGREDGDTLDVAGGWYDAGDYGKYVPPGAVTVGQMLLAYEQYPDAFGGGQCDIPPGLSQSDRHEQLPDVLVEAKFELEWLERMQRPDGAVYHKVAAAEWPDLDEAPSDDTRERHVYGFSTFGTAQFAAAMAMAARVYEPFDPAFAQRALSNAREAHEYLVADPDPHFRFDEGQDDGSGPYRKETDDEERFWATAELLKTTGESRFSWRTR